MSDEEWKLYDKVCKGRFTELEGKMDKLGARFVAGLTGLIGILVVVVVDLVVHLP